MTIPHAPFKEMDEALRQTLIDSGVSAAHLSDVGAQPVPSAENAANRTIAPNAPEDDGLDQPERVDQLAMALYGDDFPLVNPVAVNVDWVSWVRGRWAIHGPAVERHLHLIERNRLFRSGQQWVSSRSRGPWREPLKPVDAARVVCNVIDKSLDQRLQIITDQRPGFTVIPKTNDAPEKRKAEARQMALDYQYDEQAMDQQMQVAGYWAQTDGVAFWHTFWDAEKGPWDARMGEKEGERKPLGDLRTVTNRCEQVRVSANATKTEAPYYVIIREVIPATESAYRYGYSGVQPGAQTNLPNGVGDGASGSGMNQWVLDQTTIGEGDRMRNQAVVERFTIYIEPHPDILPDGLQMVVVGDALVWGPGPLLFGMIPVVAVRDGSTDPSYFPRPIMEQWLDHQVRINALLSSAVESIRVNKSGRFLSKPGAITQETFVGGGTSILEVNGTGALDDIIRPVSGFSVGDDVWHLLQFEVKKFEDASGWNDTSRGQISSDASGRAILAAREQLERVFAPPVQAEAQAFTRWGKIQLGGMAWGYDIPRDLGTVGDSRPDLARALSGADFDGPASVKVEAETLMPMPTSYRRFIMDSYLQRQLITPQQYMRNEKFASVKNLGTPDEDQEARAKRVADAIRTRTPVPAMRWQDNEAIHQDVLERDILLQDDLEQDIIDAADARWKQLAGQAQQKSTGQAPPPNGGGSPPAPSGGPSPFTPPPSAQPLATSLPSIAAAPVAGGAESPHAPA